MATKKKKSVGRPKQHPAIRFARTFKTHATGETKNSPTTVPNIIFFLGLFLIVASAIKSGRLTRFLTDIWQPASAGATTIASDLGNQFRVVGLQIVALFSATVIARFIPPLSRPILIVFVGTTILFIMNNPEILQWLNAQEQAAAQFQNNSPSTSSTTSKLTPQELTKTQQDLANVLKQRLARTHQ